MSKTTEDYRNIVKILKLQLLKVRQQNASLSHQMGIISESETSSFTPKLNHYRQSEEPFAQRVVQFLDFAHRCELVGICPEMVFRIADKKRDKSVSKASLLEIMKRVRLRMSDDQIDKLLSYMVKRGSIVEYEDYMQCLSAFQINSEKYPLSSSRTYVQWCLLQFGKICKQKFPQIRKLFSNIAESDNCIKYDNFVDFCSKECRQLKPFQIVGIFLGLDIQSMCKIPKEIFERQMDKMYSLIDRGLVDEKSLISQKAKRSPTKQKVSVQKDDFQENDQQRGDQKGNKVEKRSIVKEVIKGEKLSDQTSTFIVGQLRKKSVSYAKFISKILQKQKSKADVYYRSFSFNQFKDALMAASRDFKNKEIVKLFKKIDVGLNGSVSTQQLIKIFLKTELSQIKENSGYIFSLFYRHLKEIQFPDPLAKFTSLGYKSTQTVTQNILANVFEKLNLSQKQIKQFYICCVKNMTVQNFSQNLKNPTSTQGKSFKSMDKDLQKDLLTILKTNKPQDKITSQFKKLIKDPNLKADNEGQTWQTIFTNEWDCFKYCLDVASKLTTFWRDPEFGPTKGDPYGLRSIVGNQSERPPAIPPDEDIVWLTYEQILAGKQISQKVVLMDSQVKSTDVVQGTLGDCWYISALSTITLNEDYVRGKPFNKCQSISDLTFGLFPSLLQVFNKFGIYVLKFYKKFEPVYVVVDQLFPAETSSKDLIFARSSKDNVQWVAFAQKAYAKLHHTYSSMISGDIAQGLSDLTNSLPLKQVLKLGDTTNIKNLKKLNDKRQLMGCSIKIPKQDSSSSGAHEKPYLYNDMKCGLVAGHAYSIIDCIGLKDNVQQELIRVRNPWGKSEWLLEWSDNPIDKQYDQLEKNQKLIDDFYVQKRKEGKTKPGPYGKNEDGQFLMPIEDWNNIFNNLFIGFNESYELSKREYHMITDKWGGQKQSGVCKGSDPSPALKKAFVSNNHQYIMEIKKDKTEVLMLLTQMDGRLFRGQKYPYKEIVDSCILLVFKLGKNGFLEQYDKKQLADPNRSLILQPRRDASYWKEFNQGRYAIIPCRNAKSDKITQFQFRVFSGAEITLTKKDSPKDVFKKVNIKQAVQDNRQKYSKLIQILDKNKSQ